VAWSALSTLNSLQDATDESEHWIRVNAELVSLSDELGGLMVDTHDHVRRDVSLDIDLDRLSSRTSEAMDRLQVDLVAMAEPDREQELVRLVERFEANGLDVIRRVGLVFDAAEEGDEDAVDWHLRHLLYAHNGFRLNLENLQSTTADIETTTLERLADDGQRRLQQMTVAAVPVVLLIGAMLYVSRRVRRREESLLVSVDNARERFQAILDCLPLEVAWKALDHRLLGTNRVLRDRLDIWQVDEPIGEVFSAVGPSEASETWRAVEELEARAIEGERVVTAEFRVRTEHDHRTLRYSSSPLVQADEVIGIVTSAEDVTEARQMELALATSGRMESIGQLAAGVAHEINTPIQFVSDNTEFLTESFADLVELTSRLSEIAGGPDEAKVAEAIEAADVDFLRREVPQALAQSKEGLARVTEIVQAMKNFSHPGVDVADVDLNAIIESTVSISRNEWKYVADLDLELMDDLPLVRCREGELKQVILNMVVNAAHAVEAARESGEKGRIKVTTRVVGDIAQISIRDDGAGMPPEIRERIFDQFFTTKEVGKGTGQGLALAWDVVRGHEGTIEVESEVGQGSTFRINLPLHMDLVGSASAQPAQPVR
ncbi:MAG: ATP-binding protein, partial [Actinomycetota bacterium]